MDEAYVIAGALAVAALIISYFAYLDIKYVKKINDMHRAVHSELSVRAETYKCAATRADLMAQAFAKVLIDLAHTDNGASIEWKLHHIRGVEALMSHSVWRDESLYGWLYEKLQYGPYDVKRIWIDKIEQAVKSYYVMDVDTGENICDILRLVADMSVWDDACKDKYVQKRGDLVKSIDALQLRFLMYDEEAEAERKAAMESNKGSFEALLEALKSLSDTIDSVPKAKAPAPVIIEEVSEEGSNSNVRIEPEPEATETVRQDREAGASPELQGEQVERKDKAVPGQVPEDIRPQVDDVIVVSRRNTQVRVEPADE